MDSQDASRRTVTDLWRRPSQVVPGPYYPADRIFGDGPELEKSSSADSSK